MKNNNSSVLKDTKKTIAQQLKIKEFPFIITDKQGERIYEENQDGFWTKTLRHPKGWITDYETSEGYWCKREYDSEGREIYLVNSRGESKLTRYDQNGECIYLETSWNGVEIDKLPKVVELTLRQVAEKLNIDVNLLRIKE
jgi:hypothetical protein